MKASLLRITAVIMTLAMVMGMLVIIPTTASAAEVTDVTATASMTAPVITLAADADKWDGKTLTEPALGDDGNYHITTAAEFVYMVRTLGADIANTTGKTFVLDKDLDMNNNSVAGIQDGYPFGGTFDGQGHTIANAASTTNWGNGKSFLFSTVSTCIKNTNFLNCKVGTAQDNVSASGVINTLLAGGVVENVHINYANANSGTAGGIVTYCSGTVKNCIVSGKLNIAKDGGGITATLGQNGVITGCINYSDNNATVPLGGGVGGIIGRVTGESTTVTDNKNYGNISAVTDNTAGIIGAIEKKCADTIKIENNYNYGNIFANGKGNAAGILNITSADNGTNFTTMKNCHNYGNVTATTGIAGGIIGRSGSAAVFSNCFNHGDISASSYAGGIIGLINGREGSYTNRNTHFRITNCGSYGNITGKYAGTVSGGAYSNTVASEMVGIVAVGEVTTTDIGTSQYGALGYLNNGGGTGIFNLKFTNCYFNVPICQAMAEGASISTVTYGGKVYVDNADSTFGTLAVTTVTNATCLAQYNASGSLSYAVGVYNRLVTDLSPWVITGEGDNAAPIPATQLGFSGATMTLGGNMALNIKLNGNVLKENGTNTSVSFVNADTEEGVKAEKDANGYYSVSYADIRAMSFADELHLYTAVSVNGTTYTSSNILTYSPATYLTNLYNNYAGEDAEAVDKVAVNMLYYGAAAEANATGVAIDKTATAAKATAAGITLPTAFAAEGYLNASTNTDDDKAIVNANTAGVGVALTGGIHLTLNGMTTGDTVAVTVGVESKLYTADANGQVEIDMINADAITDVITLAFENGTANISVGNVLESYRNDEMITAAQKTLAEATIMYMMSVMAYAR